MAAPTYAPMTSGLRSTDQIRTEIRERILQAREARKPHEKTWLSNLAFAAGQHWLVWSDQAGQLVERRRVDPVYQQRDTYTANRIREYLNAQLGELSTGDDRPDLVTAVDGDDAEQVATELNQAVAYGWEHEWNADQALRRARGYALTMGTAAIRCRFDKTKGPVAGRLAITPDGKPVTHPDELAALEQTGALTDGTLPRFVQVNEGRTCWEALTAFQILFQPGVTHEEDLGWFDLVRPVAIDTLAHEYGDIAQQLVEDGDIASAMGLATGQQTRTGAPSQGRLRGHVWLHTMYDMPCRRYPNGRVTVLASNSYVLLDVQEQLDYQLPGGAWHPGVVFLHWNRLDDRGYSQAFIEPLKDPQRSINEIKSAQLEILWRGLPKVFTKEGDLIRNPAGLPLENIELKPDAAQPSFFAGLGPGPWMDEMVAQCDNDLSHASTLSPLKLGENPANVDTYSQLALLNENENYKRSVIVSDHERQISTLVECGVYDIKTYWPEAKQILVAGDGEGSFASATFAKARIPVWYQAKVGTGAAVPRSQAAELKKVDAIWAAAVQSGVAVTNPQAWIRWYDESLDASQALDLPEVEQDSQERMARYENLLMLNGQQVAPMPYDLAPVHIPVHREAQDEARARGDMATVQAIEQHVQATVMQQQQNAAMVAAAQQTPSPAAPPGNPVYASPDFLRLAAGN